MKTLSCQTTIELVEELTGGWYATLYISHLDSDAAHERRFGVITGTAADPIEAVRVAWQRFADWKLASPSRKEIA